MAHLVSKVLPLRHEGLSLDPWYTCEESSMASGVCNSSALGKGRDKWTLDSLSSQNSKTGGIQVSVRVCFKKM